MDRGWIVFLIASAASYYPVYWCLNRFVALRRRASGARPNDRPADPRTQFLQFLRQEAIGRVDATLSDVLAHATRTGRTSGSAPHGFDQSTVSRLQETRRLVIALFPVEAATAFDTVLMAVKNATPAGAEDAYDAIVGFTGRLSHSLEA